VFVDGMVPPACCDAAPDTGTAPWLLSTAGVYAWAPFSDLAAL
jgi:hypothetical protein